jgi:hypothetical protein
LTARVVSLHAIPDFQETLTASIPRNDARQKRDDKEDQVAAKSKPVRLDANISDVAGSGLKHEEGLDCEFGRRRKRH